MNQLASEAVLKCFYLSLKMSPHRSRLIVTGLKGNPNAPHQVLNLISNGIKAFCQETRTCEGQMNRNETLQPIVFSSWSRCEKEQCFFAVNPMLEGGGIAEKSGSSSSRAQPADVTFGYSW